MIYCMIGISGSGKTTLANDMVKYLENGIIVGRDPLREMLFGYTQENQVYSVVAALMNLMSHTVLRSLTV